LRKLEWDPDRRLLENTCTLVETLRLDELVSAHDVLAKAIGADASLLASAVLRRELGWLEEPRLAELTTAMGGLLANTLANGTANTERDAQVLLLSLGRIGGIADESPAWRLSIELGMAVLTECLRAGECPDDELERLLRQETASLRRDQTTAKTTNLGRQLTVDEQPRSIIEAWPTLPELLGRAGSVMRPPPGTPPVVTAANAIIVVLEVIEHVLKESANRAKVCLTRKGAEALGLTIQSTKDCSFTRAKVRESGRRPT
jgi:hypothetical protein